MSRRVFITGAGRRIGRALALRFAHQGWSVAVHYSSSEEKARATYEEIAALGGRASIVQADVRDRAAIRDAIAQGAGELGGLDVLVNNAGIYPPATPIADVTEELWREVLETNLYGEFFAAQAAAEIMLGQEPGADGLKGRIVNLSSLGAFQIWKDRIPYNVSKAGVVQLTRALARALAPDIAVNSVAPGAIEIPEEPVSGGMIAPARIPMKRHGSVDDIFNAVRFFAEASSYVTGETLVVDGGLNIAQETSQE
jgi:NAD(P)-dependent dehydrogenase (short-subunit alcohol dehydrogenase family)